MGDSTTEVDESEKRNGNQSYENGAGLESLVVYASREPALYTNCGKNLLLVGNWKPETEQAVH
jgi:hypothetical protein